MTLGGFSGTRKEIVPASFLKGFKERLDQAIRVTFALIPFSSATRTPYLRYFCGVECDRYLGSQSGGVRWPIGAKGTRVMVTNILDSLTEGASREEILKSYPSLQPQHTDATIVYLMRPRGPAKDFQTSPVSAPPMIRAQARAFRSCWSLAKAEMQELRQAPMAQKLPHFTALMSSAQNPNWIDRTSLGEAEVRQRWNRL